MATSTLEGNIVVRGNLRSDSLSVPANTIGDNEFKAANPLTVEKQQHQYSQIHAQDHGSAAVSQRAVIHVARGAGTIRNIRAGITVAFVGAATITMTLLKNGASITSGTFTLDTGNAIHTTEDMTLTSSTYSAGDVFELNITATAGGGTLAQGLFVQMVVKEDES